MSTLVNVVCPNPKCKKVLSLPMRSVPEGSNAKVQCLNCKATFPLTAPVAPPAAASPYAPSSDNSAFSDYSTNHEDHAEEMAQLVKMGFTDREENKKALAENRGDVFAAVAAINKARAGGSVSVSPSKPLSAVATGKPRSPKRAVLIGIEYTGTEDEIEGCVLDVQCMKHMLVTRFGFPEEYVILVTELEKAPSQRPTKKNILFWMNWLVKNAADGDQLFFHFSGNGGSKRSLGSAMGEVDGYNETLIPTDSKFSGVIVDDDINKLMINKLPRGATLNCLIDACHSGTVMDLQFVAGLAAPGHPWMWEDENKKNRVFKGTAGGEAICISACADNQELKRTKKGAEASTEPSVTGAVTFSYIEAIENAFDKGETPTYSGIVTAINEKLNPPTAPAAAPVASMAAPVGYPGSAAKGTLGRSHLHKHGRVYNGRTSAKTSYVPQSVTNFMGSSQSFLGNLFGQVNGGQAGTAAGGDQPPPAYAPSPYAPAGGKPPGYPGAASGDAGGVAGAPAPVAGGDGYTVQAPHAPAAAAGAPLPASFGNTLGNIQIPQAGGATLAGLFAGLTASPIYQSAVSTLGNIPIPYGNLRITPGQTCQISTASPFDMNRELTLH